jgi:hypothetical protein
MGALVSLLDGGAHYVPVTVYPQVVVTDEDGNTQTKASDVGIDTVGRVQLITMTGTARRDAEQNDKGFYTEQDYRIRFPRSFDTSQLGPQAKVLWNGQLFSIFGFPQVYQSSRRTQHQEFSIKRGGSTSAGAADR